MNISIYTSEQMFVLPEISLSFNIGLQINIEGHFKKLHVLFSFIGQFAISIRKFFSSMLNFLS
jgi:hypothetical protein